VQQRAERAGGFGRARRLLELPEDLRLAQHHRIEARGDAEDVPHGLLARQRVEVGPQSIGLEAVVAREPVRDRRRFLAGDIKLGAIAGREDRRFAREVSPDFSERLAQSLDVKHHPLANRERRRLVIQPESVQRHAA